MKPSPVIDNAIFGEWAFNLFKRILTIDVSDLKDKEIKNINEGVIANRQGDIGVDNKRNSYRFTNGEWKGFCS